LALGATLSVGIRLRPRPLPFAFPFVGVFGIIPMPRAWQGSTLQVEATS